jgi:hypothetical protein
MIKSKTIGLKKQSKASYLLLLGEFFSVRLNGTYSALVG